MLLVSKQKSPRVALAGLTFDVTSVDLERMIPEDMGTISMEVLLWGMAEAMNSSDPQQRSCWYDYRARLSSANPELEGMVNLRIIDIIDEET